MFSQRRENDHPVQAGARQHPSPRDSRGDSVTAKLEDFVILSAATASRSGAVAESKDPTSSNWPPRVREFSHARADEFSATAHPSPGIRTGMTGDVG